MGHTCSTALIKCMDFRLTGDVHEWMLRKNLVNDCDVISVAGAAKDIVENAHGYVASLVKLAVELHQVKKIIFMHHLDCGAYGGSSAFSTPADELSRHQSEIRRAAEIIAGQFPGIQIETYLAAPADTGWRIEAI